MLPDTALLLSVIVSVPERLPSCVGVNVTLIVQLPLAATELPQSLVCAKSPVVMILVMVNGASPVLLNVTVWTALVLPTSWFPKSRLVADWLTIGRIPVPVRLSICGLLVASSKTVTVATRLPRVVGRKMRLILQLAPAARALPQVLFSPKSLLFGPPTPISLMFTGTFPGLVKVTSCAELLVPTSWLA